MYFKTNAHLHPHTIASWFILFITQILSPPHKILLQCCKANLIIFGGAPLYRLIYTHFYTLNEITVGNIRHAINSMYMCFYVFVIKATCSSNWISLMSQVIFNMSIKTDNFFLIICHLILWEIKDKSTFFYVHQLLQIKHMYISLGNLNIIFTCWLLHVSLSDWRKMSPGDKICRDRGDKLSKTSAPCSIFTLIDNRKMWEESMVCTWTSNSLLTGSPSFNHLTLAGYTKE